MRDNVWIIIGVIAGICVVGFIIARLMTIAEYKQSLKDDHIKRTKIIAVNGIEKSVTKGALARGIIGGFIAGAPGAALGALTANTETRTVKNVYTFLVYYDNKFNPVVEKVTEGTSRFQTLVNKLESAEAECE